MASPDGQDRDVLSVGPRGREQPGTARSKFSDQEDFEQARRLRDRLCFAYFHLAEQMKVGRLQAKEGDQIAKNGRDAAWAAVCKRRQGVAALLGFDAIAAEAAPTGRYKKGRQPASFLQHNFS